MAVLFAVLVFFVQIGARHSMSNRTPSHVAHSLTLTAYCLLCVAELWIWTRRSPSLAQSLDRNHGGGYVLIGCAPLPSCFDLPFFIPPTFSFQDKYDTIQETRHEQFLYAKAGIILEYEARMSQAFKEKHSEMFPEW